MENACGTSHVESAGEVVKILYDMVEKWTKKHLRDILLLVSSL